MTQEAQAPPAAAAGLTREEAARRLAARGDLPPPPSSRSVASIVRSNTLTLFNLILAAFFVLILAAGRPADGLFAGILVANTAIGIIQELRAKRVLDRAALLVQPQARVVRDGAEESLEMGQIVDGDLVNLRSGDQVVADGEVVSSVGMMLDESALSGESLPVAHDGGDRVLSGSYCVEGSGSYVVTATGPDSYAWRLLGTARANTAERSPLEQQINQLLRLMVAVMIPLGAALIWTLVRRHTPFREAAATATAGIVTLIPEGLVLLMSLTFAVAAVRLSRRGMLVQYMNAIESLANVDTVCLDKTGTLTDGTLELRELIPLGGADEADLRAQLSSYAASAGSRNATLDAVAAGLPGEAQPAAGEVPFSSRWKWSALDLDGTWLVLGAPDVLLAGAQPPQAVEHERTGRRVLAFGLAPGGVETDDRDHRPPALEPLGLVVLEERLRDDARDTIAFLYDQGVEVKVMSGDSPTTVAAVADRVGIRVGEEAVDGSSLPQDAEQLAAVASTTTVFARLRPEDKRRLIEALRQKGAYVAMIGDGVNDVPAMKSARLAVALGSGTQLAKSVADAVLVSDRFGAIPDAVAEGRRIIGNVQRVAKLFVTKSVFAAFVIATFGLWTGEFPLLPRHLSLAATFTVGVPGFVLALGPASGIPETGGFVRRVLRFALPAGAVMGAATLIAYLAVGDVRGHSDTEARTAAVTVYVAIGLYLLLVLDAERMQRSPRYAGLVVALAASLGAGYLLVLGTPALRQFFALTVPGFWAVLVMVGCGVGAVWALSRFGLSPYRGSSLPDPASTAERST
ncbi:MAG TPA: HAD-IC family P-type ATPase [Gaiellales bacterium]|nr:HAD-IC family P-type ATPase [Gaiellales bacterium]